MSHGLFTSGFYVRLTLRKNLILFRVEAFLFQAGRDLSHQWRYLRAHPVQLLAPIGLTLGAVVIVHLETSHNLVILSFMSFVVGAARGGK